MKLIAFTIIIVLVTACSNDNRSRTPNSIYLAQKAEYEREIEVWNESQNKPLISFNLQIEKISRNAIIRVYSEGGHYTLEAIRDSASEPQVLKFNNWESPKEPPIFNGALSNNAPELNSTKTIKKIVQLVALIHEPVFFPPPSPDKDQQVKSRGRTEEGCIYNFDDLSGLLIDYRCVNAFDSNVGGFLVSIEKISKVGEYWLPMNGVIQLIDNTGEADVFYFTARRTKIADM